MNQLTECSWNSSPAIKILLHFYTFPITNILYSWAMKKELLSIKVLSKKKNDFEKRQYFPYKYVYDSKTFSELF